jgi:hypothetical protein
MADLRGKSAYTAVSITTSGGFGSATGGSCVTISATMTVNINGGVAPYSVTWTRTSGGATPTSRSVSISTTSDSFTVSQFLCPGGEVSGSYLVTVSDTGPGGGLTSSASATVFYNMIHFGGGIIQ